jgi:hemolysin activation/secretion protein
MAVGGANTVRGYRENALVRDQVLLGSLELRYGLLNPALQVDYGRLYGAVFTDFAHAWNRNSNTANPDETVHSIGVGLLWSWQDKIQTQLYWGHQLKSLHTPGGGSWQDDGIHARLQATY